MIISVDNVFTARALLSADASINALDESGRTPLVIAAVHGMAHLNFHTIFYKEIVVGLNINIIRKTECLIEFVYLLGSMKVAKALIQKGADLNVGDSMGNTALHEAIKFGMYFS